MLKQITNLNGVNIGINRIVDGNSTKYINQATNQIKTGQTMLYKFNNIPFNEIKKVANARLLIPALGYGTFEIGVFRNTSAYITSQTHGNNEPTYDTSTYIHYEKFTIGKSAGTPESRMLEINLTNLFNRWLSEEATNLSFTLRCLSTANLTVFGPNHPELEGKTLFALTYAQTDTFSSSFDYLTDELSFGGQSFVNTLTGRLAHQFDVFQTESKKFPIKFSVNYIERLTGVTMKNSLIGNWRTNFDFGFKIEDNRITVVSPEGSIAYFDKTLREDAAKHDIYIGTKPHCYINFMDNSYIVEDVSQKYKMYDAGKNVYEFNANNMILKITKEDGTYINFGYNASSQVNSITSSDGYQVTVSYMSGRVQYVNFINEDRRLYLTYSGSGLTTISLQKLVRTVTYTGTVISYPNIITTSFVHVGEKLSRITNEKTNEGLYFEYSGDKVIKLTNTIKNGSNYLNGSYREMDYLSNYTKISDFEGEVQYLTHDSYGMLLQTIDSRGTSVSLKHSSVGMDGIARKLSDNSGVIPIAKNRLLDSSFELLGVEGISSSTLGWKTNNAQAVKQVEDGVYGRHALSIIKISGASAQVHQTIYPNNGTYTLECFVKTKDIVGSAKIKVHSTFTKYIIAEPGMPNTETIVNDYESTAITSEHSKWTRIVVPGIFLQDRNQAGSIKIVIDGMHTGGELFVDAVKFTNESYAINGNLLLGGDMESSTLNNFTKVNCNSQDQIVSASLELPHSLVLGTKRFRFMTAKDVLKSLEREINLSGASGDSLTFAFWGKSAFDNAAHLKGKIIFKKCGEIVQTVESGADQTLSDWQLISTSVVTKRPYDSVKLVIEYIGINQCFIDNISLFRENFSTLYSYNEKGNLLEKADNVSSASYKTDGSKIVESNDESGEQYQYTYDEDGKVTKVIDHKGNVIDLEYVNGNRTKSKITSDGKTLELSNTFNSRDQVLTTTDELGNITSFTYDLDSRLRTRTEANGLVTTNSYDDLNNLVGLVKSKSGTSMSASYEYYANNLLKKIICENGTNYEFIYDTFGRVTQIKLNGGAFVSYEYGIVKNGVTTDNITKQTIGTDIYTFSYDTRLRLREVKLGTTVIATYEYDSDSNISKKTSGANISYYDYDNKGKVLRETRENGDSLNYDYDNLEQLQKAIIDINGMQRSYDYEYLNEYNEYSKENLKTRIDKAFNDDIIDYNALNSGLYGAKSVSAWGMKASFGDEKVFRLNRMTSKIIYPLESVNSTRKTAAYGGAFNRNEWKGKFENSKTMFGWYRFTGTIGAGHKIFAFGNDTTDQYYVTITKSGSNFQFKLYSASSLVATRTIQATSELIFIGLRLYKGSGINQTQYDFTVNGVFSSGFVATTNYVANLTKFVLGDRSITTGSMTDNPFLQDVSLISIGAYEYTNEIFQTIRQQENRFQNMNLKPKTGVSFANQKTYENFEVMSLNGSFKSNKGRMPSDYEFIDGTFKLDKTKLFKYDESLERHVYGSYSTAQGFGLVKGLLSYKHDLTNYGVVSLNFKLEGSSSVNKTLFDFKDGSISKLKVFRNASGKLALLVNGTPHETDISVAMNQWHRILVTFVSNNIKIWLNDYDINVDIPVSVDVTNTKLYVGSSVLTNGKPTEHMDGVTEMLALKKTYLGSAIDEVKRIISGEQQLSVKTEIDVMGRSHKDIIDTGILETGGQSTKQLINEYAYEEPETGKTSLQVSSIEGFDGYNKAYSYDEIGNITKIKVTGGDIVNFDEYKYKYDLLSRLVEEYNPSIDRTIKYEYNLNNNIKKATYYIGETTSVDKTETYNYDASYKDKLMSITTLKDGVSTTESIVYGSNHVPTSFLGKALTWQGRRLKTYDSDSYEYNDAGIRTSKTVDGVPTQYHLIGDKVGSLTKGASKLFFHYNERDMLVGFEHNKENYFYSRDLTGIIHTIIDKNGDVMVEYVYDAWGNWLNKDTAAKTSIGETLLALNPFIYKGYIYDDESGLYYLKSRYYSPKVRRFINTDDRIGATGDVGEYNLFAYCSNNPIIGIDPNGTWDWGKIGKGLRRVVTGVVAVVVGVAVIASCVSGVGMIVIAAATITAGVLTAINGIADTTEGVLDNKYNFVRDGLFGGNQTTYDRYSSITEFAAIIGTAICGSWLKINRPRIKAYKSVENYKFSGTLSDETHTSRSPQQSTLLQKQIIKYGKMTKESKGVYRFVAPGTFRIGPKSNLHSIDWKLVVDIVKEIIFHIFN